MERAPLATSETLGHAVQRVVVQANSARDAGDVNWWRQLEAALASVGSQADDVVECTQEEVDAGKPAPVDIGSLLSNVVPALLRLTGE
jgi:hypothetical protein